MFDWTRKLGKMVGGVASPKASRAPGRKKADADPAEYNHDQVDSIAEDMSERQRVDWATKAAERVKDKLMPEDVKALEAAVKWLDSPSIKLGDVAGEAASAAGHGGPGAWAAQAAAWASGPAAPASGAMAEGLSAKAAAGAVKLASALAQDPTALQAARAAAPGSPPPTDGGPSPPSDSSELAASQASDSSTQSSGDRSAAAGEVAESGSGEPTEQQLAEKASALKPFIELGRSILTGELPGSMS